MIRVPTIFDFDQGNRKLDAGCVLRPAYIRTGRDKDPARIAANIAKLPELLRKP
jgi:hypothetical protein